MVIERKLLSKKIEAARLHPAGKGEIPVLLELHFLFFRENDHVLRITQYDRCQPPQRHFIIQEVDAGIRARLDDRFELEYVVVRLSDIRLQVIIEPGFDDGAIFFAVVADETTIGEIDQHGPHLAGSKAHVLGEVFGIDNVITLRLRELLDGKQGVHIAQPLEFEKTVLPKVIRGFECGFAFPRTADHFQIDQRIVDLPVQSVVVHVDLMERIIIRCL